MKKLEEGRASTYIKLRALVNSLLVAQGRQTAIGQEMSADHKAVGERYDRMIERLAGFIRSSFNPDDLKILPRVVTSSLDVNIQRLDLIAGELHKINPCPGGQGRGGKGTSVIYSIGYQKLDQKTLIEILKAHQVEVLVDVRSRPYGRITVFNRNAMQRWLPEAGIDYLWKGDILGGFAPIEEDAIRWLADFGRERTVCIMCMEANPEKCHRKTEIARRIEAYGVSVEHI